VYLIYLKRCNIMYVFDQFNDDLHAW